MASELYQEQLSAGQRSVPTRTICDGSRVGPAVLPRTGSFDPMGVGRKQEFFRRPRHLGSQIQSPDFVPSHGTIFGIRHGTHGTLGRYRQRNKPRDGGCEHNKFCSVTIFGSYGRIGCLERRLVRLVGSERTRIRLVYPLCRRRQRPQKFPQGTIGQSCIPTSRTLLCPDSIRSAESIYSDGSRGLSQRSSRPPVYAIRGCPPRNIGGFAQSVDTETQSTTTTTFLRRGNRFGEATSCFQHQRMDRNRKRHTIGITNPPLERTHGQQPERPRSGTLWTVPRTIGGSHDGRICSGLCRDDSDGAREVRELFDAGLALASESGTPR
mmetsp:Transcript_11225/g.23795  ORF Transcript_11225/g.23795 Transcript_11225/m.23795 type:complete len:324 (-) Transcript_11225:572-1543(-)